MASFATQVQIRRGTEAENDAFTGAEGEVTMDLTNKQLRVHDGQTTGGMKIPNIEDVQEELNNAVDKTSNQTITGQKTFQRPIVHTNRGVALQAINSSGAKVASFGSLSNVVNLNEAFMYVYNDDGTINSYLSLYYNNGAPFVLLGPSYNLPLTENNNKLVYTAWVHSLLSQVINDSAIGSNYVYIGDLLIQWGYTARKPTIDLIKPFANTDYFVSMQNISSVNVPGYGTDLINIKALNTTSFELQNADIRFPIKWIAIGKGA